MDVATWERPALLVAFAVAAFVGLLGTEVVQVVRQPLIIGITIPCWLAPYVPPGTLNFLVRIGVAIAVMQRVERRGSVAQWRQHFWKVAKAHAIGGYLAADLLDLVRVFRGGECG